MKYKRQSEIIKIIQEKQIKTHEQLIDELQRAGYEVTQATVSRDIKDLGLIKAPSNTGGAYYSMPEDIADTGSRHINMFSNTVKEITAAMHTIVVKTYPGMAPAVAASVDSGLRSEIVGTVAGDDTVLVITLTPEKAAEVTEKLRKIFKA